MGVSWASDAEGFEYAAYNRGFDVGAWAPDL